MNGPTLMVVLAAVIAVPAWSADIQAAGVPNFHQVNQHLYRGGQPAEEGWASLAKLGVKIVVDLFFQPHELPTRKYGDRQRSFRAVGVEHPGEFWRAEIRSLSPHFRVGSSWGWKNGREWRGLRA